jgi:hypothetical protein
MKSESSQSVLHQKGWSSFSNTLREKIFNDSSSNTINSSDTSKKKENLSFFMSNIPNATIFFSNQKQQASLRSWMEELPEGWVDSFLHEGLQMFLKRYGYTIQITENLKRRFIAWAWSHYFVYYSQSEKKCKVKVPQILHNGDDDEFNYYCYLIDYEDWQIFMNKWELFQLFDESDVGQLQRSDFHYFVWSVLDLSNSPSHHHWCDLMDHQPEDSDKEAKIYETEHYDQAYGGDRRTL